MKVIESPNDKNISKNAKKIPAKVKKVSAKKRFVSVMLASTITFGGVAYLDYFSKRNVPVTIAMTNAEKGKKVPIFNENGEVISQVSDGQLVFYEEPDEKNSELNEVTYLSDTGEMVIGNIENKYLDSRKGIFKGDLKEYKDIYEVVPEEGTYIKESAQNSSENVSTILEGEYLLGGTQILSSEDEKMWIPVMSVNERTISKGYVRSDELRKVNTLDKRFTEKTKDINDKIKKMIVDTSANNNINLKLRESTEIQDNNISAEIPHGAIVTLMESDVVELGDRKWAKVTYTDVNGKELIGWVKYDYLKEYNQVKMIVNTGKDNNLIVRKEPGKKSEKVAEIQNGTALVIPQSNIEKIERSDFKKWVKIELPDGTEGYVRYDYLEEEKTSEKGKKMDREVEADKKDDKMGIDDIILKEIMGKIESISTENVVGIDVSESATPEQLKEILTVSDAIPDKLNGNNTRNVNTSDLQGKVNFVYIKLGASGYKYFSQKENENYINQAKECEKQGIPYGFYFYSTAISTEEAEKEAEYIKNKLENIENAKYNLLPFCIDVELYEQNDRQLGVDVTDAKAHLANLIEHELGKTILYTCGRAASNVSSEKILDIDRYKNALDSKDCNIWLAAPRGNNTEMSKSHATFYEDMKNHANIPMIQTVLDATLKNRTDVDINTIGKEDFYKLLQESINKTKTANIEEGDMDNYR